MTGLDKELATTVHELVTKNTDLRPKTYYGMPAYANADGKARITTASHLRLSKPP